MTKRLSNIWTIATTVMMAGCAVPPLASQPTLTALDAVDQQLASGQYALILRQDFTVAGERHETGTVLVKTKNYRNQPEIHSHWYDRQENILGSTYIPCHEVNSVIQETAGIVKDLKYDIAGLDKRMAEHPQDSDLPKISLSDKNDLLVIQQAQMRFLGAQALCNSTYHQLSGLPFKTQIVPLSDVTSLLQSPSSGPKPQ